MKSRSSMSSASISGRESLGTRLNQRDSLATGDLSITAKSTNQSITKCIHHLCLVPPLFQGTLSRVPVTETVDARQNCVLVRPDGRGGASVTSPPRHTLHTLTITTHTITHNVTINTTERSSRVTTTLCTGKNSTSYL